MSCHNTFVFLLLLANSLRANKPTINDPFSLFIPIHFNTSLGCFPFSQLLWQLVTICLSLIIIIIIIIIIFGLNPFVDFIAQRWQRTALSFKLNGKRQQFAQLRFFHLHLHFHRHLQVSPLFPYHIALPLFLIALFNYFPLILATFAAAICLVTFL